MEKGKQFNNVEDAKKYIKEFNEDNFTNFVVDSNNKRSLVFICKHGVHRDSTSKGVREAQRYNYLGCNAKIRLYKSQKEDDRGILRITSVDLNHNHCISKEVFEKENVNFTEEEKELIKTLKDANARPSQIKRVLLERSKKTVTIKRLWNLLQKISPKESDEENHEALEKFLCDTEIDGGMIQWIDDKDGKAKALFITSRKMMSAFRASNPNLVQLDTSFNMDKARYKVAAFCYLDTNSDKSEIAAFGMISEESKICFEFILHHFSKICIRQDIMFIIDKDFTEQASIRKIFPGSIVLLCVFHTLKFMRVLFSTIPDTIPVKESVMSQFKKVVYANDETIFETESVKFEDLVENLQVRTNNKYVNLKDYYIKNWKGCKLMWVRCYRKTLPLLGDNTTNRIETKFGRLKESIADTFISLPTTASAIIHLVEYADRSLEERYAARTNKSLKIFSSNPRIRELNEQASLALNDKGCKIFNQALKALETKRKDLELEENGNGVKEQYQDKTKVVYSSTDKSCNCSTFQTFQAACAHVLFVREHQEHGGGPGLFSPDVFHERYHRKSALIEVLDNPLDDDGTNDDLDDVDDFLAAVDVIPEEPATLSDKEKFRLIMPKLTSIASLEALHPTKRFYEYMSEFEKVENYIRRGDSIFESFETGIDITDNEENPNLIENDSTEEITSPANKDDMDDETTQDEADKVVEGNSGNDSLSSTLPQSTRFSNLQMKEQVKTKGRPKKSSKQLTFNKTAADRKAAKAAVKPKNKKPNRAKKPAFINDESDDEDLELQLDEDEEDHYDTNSGEDEEEIELSNDESDEDSPLESSEEVVFNFKGGKRMRI